MRLTHVQRFKCQDVHSTQELLCQELNHSAPIHNNANQERVKALFEICIL